MIVQALGHQLKRQRISYPARLLHLGALILEPYFDLRFVERQFSGQRLSSFFRQVFVVFEFSLQTTQLFVRERRTRALLVGTSLFLLVLSTSRSW